MDHKVMNLNATNRKLMVIAGGPWQCDIVKTAKAMGFYVICSNLYENSPAFEFADVCELANVLDKESNLEIAKKHRPNAIVTDQSDIAVRTVAFITNKLGLPGITSEIADRFSNKYLMRLFAKKHQLPCPDFLLCDTIEQAEGFLSKHGKIIIKPIDSQSSRGVFRVNSKHELNKLFNITREYSICRKSVLAEEFIGGTEFTIDGIKTQAGHTSLAISEKRHYPEYPNVASQLLFTKDNPNFDYSRLRRENDELIKAMGLSFGLTHAEYKFDKGKFFLIEIAARGGGSNISSQITQYMSGINSNALLIQMACGEKLGKIVPEVKDERCCCLEFFDFAEGIAKNIEGEDFLASNPNILDYHINFKPGDKVPIPSDDSQRPGQFIAVAENMEKLNELRENVREKVKVAY